jgi:hypothetical protein
MPNRQTYAMVGIEPIIHKQIRNAAFYNDTTIREIVEKGAFLYIDMLEKKRAEKQEQKEESEHA